MIQKCLSPINFSLQVQISSQNKNAEVTSSSTSVDEPILTVGAVQEALNVGSFITKPDTVCNITNQSQDDK